jgi:hypothetical protein
MPRKQWEPAPPDPGPKPGGIRERAMRVMAERGPRPEDPKKTRRSQEHWAKFRAEQAKRAAAKGIKRIPVIAAIAILASIKPCPAAKITLASNGPPAWVRGQQV